MEKPFAAAFDVLETLPGVDERIALAGHSFGGYVVSRVAVFEPRVKAVIPSSPLIDINRAQKEMLEKVKLPIRILAWLTEQKMKKSPLTKSMMY
ncbi:serine aminopeptidase domain-containing protein [Chloroflexota bacterium]